MANAQFRAEYYAGRDVAQAVYLVDATGALYVASGGGGGTSSNYGSMFPAAGTAAGFTDGVAMRAATVGIFHNSDNQNPGGSAYGLLTGGVDQLINGSGNLDRKREAYGDGMATTGIEATGLMLWNGALFDRWQGKNGAGLVGRLALAVLNQTSAAQTTSGTSADLAVGPYAEIAIDLTITADSGTGQTIQFFWDRKGADGNYYPLWQSNQLASTISTPYQISTSIGAGMAYNQSLGSTGRLRWVIAGTTPSWTFSASVVGK
jgi:hypothetical protein